MYKEFDIDKADLLKFDIEGAEFSLFDSIDIQSAASSYIGELHFDLGGEKSSVEAFREKFMHKNTTIKKLYGERYIIKSN